MKHYFKTALGIAFGLLNALMLIDGAIYFLGTSGTVNGSEFGMQITLVHQLSVFMIWTSLLAAWRLAPDADSKQ